MSPSLLLFRFLLLLLLAMALMFGLSYVPFWPQGDTGNLLIMVIMAVVSAYLWRLLDRVARKYKFLSWV